MAILIKDNALVFPLSREIWLSIHKSSLLPSLFGSVDGSIVTLYFTASINQEWVHTMFVFIDLGHLPVDDFFSSFFHLLSNFLMFLFLSAK